jgi:hypothetical protein
MPSGGSHRLETDMAKRKACSVCVPGERNRICYSAGTETGGTAAVRYMIKLVFLSLFLLFFSWCCAVIVGYARAHRGLYSCLCNFSISSPS